MAATGSEAVSTQRSKSSATAGYCKQGAAPGGGTSEGAMGTKSQTGAGQPRCRAGAAQAVSRHDGHGKPKVRERPARHIAGCCPDRGNLLSPGPQGPPTCMWIHLNCREVHMPVRPTDPVTNTNQGDLVRGRYKACSRAQGCKPRQDCPAGEGWRQAARALLLVGLLGENNMLSAAELLSHWHKCGSLQQDQSI